MAKDTVRSRDELISYARSNLEDAKKIGIDNLTTPGYAPKGRLWSPETVADRVAYALYLYVHVSPGVTQYDEPILYEMEDRAEDVDIDIKDKEAWQRLFELVDKLE